MSSLKITHIVHDHNIGKKNLLQSDTFLGVFCVALKGGFILFESQS